jgi:hypothetical protein
MHDRQLSTAFCKRWLAGLWFIAAGILFFIFIFQTLLDHYGARTRDAWGWFLPTISPTLSLILSVLVMDALGKGMKTEKTSIFIFCLSFGLSLAYLVAVGATIFIQPFIKSPPVELMEMSNIFLGPFQGFVSASLGVFFVKGES